SVSSLLDSLMKESQDDQRVEILNEISWKYLRIDYDSAEYFAEEALKISQKNEYIQGIGTAYNRLGIVHQKRLELSDAEKYYQKSLQYRMQSGDSLVIARAINNLALVKMKLNRFDEATELYGKAIGILSNLERWGELASARNNLGNLYKDLGQLRNALNEYLESLRLRKKLDGRRGIEKTYVSIALIHKRVRNFNLAKAYLDSAISINEANSYKYGLSQNYLNLGLIYYEKGDWDYSIKEYIRALDLKKETRDTLGIVAVYLNLSALYRNTENLMVARDYLSQGLKLLQIKDIENARLKYLIALGQLDAIEGKYISAISYLEQASALAKKIDSELSLIEISELLAKLFAERDDYKRAFLTIDRNNELKDSLSMDKLNSAAILSQYEIVQRENLIHQNELRFQREQNQMQRNLNYVLGLFSVSLIIIGVFWSRNKQIIQRALTSENKVLHAEKNEMIFKQRIDDLVQEKEIESINAMLEGQEEERQRISRELHDTVGSMLYTLKLFLSELDSHIDRFSQKSKEQSETAIRLLDQSYEEVRRISQNLVSGVLVKFGLIAELERLFSTIKETNHLNIQFLYYGLEDRLENKTEISIYRIVQELTSNTLKHAKAQEMTIQLNKKYGLLNIMVEDDGVGFDPEIISVEKSGIGLRNVRARVEAMGGQLFIDSGKGAGTTVSIDIPLI
ncbi:MAG: sensor histidine kinase, partial [Cyanobacteria bacterium J06649_11]